MSLISNLDLLVSRLATEFRSLRTMISGSATGGTAMLNTTATDLVGAVNELKGEIDALPKGLEINDGVTSLTETWSSSKIDSEIDTAIAELVGTAPAALNTLQEIAAALNNDASIAATFTTALSLKADASNVYTIAQVDSALADKVSSSDVYTQAQVDSLLSSKAAVGDSYLKAETYSAASIDAALALKADASAVATISGDLFALDMQVDGIETNLGTAYGSTNFVAAFETALNA